MANHFGIYLTNDSNDTIELPLNPAELMLKYETDDKSETVIKLGEINRIGEEKLTSAQIQSTLPVAPKDEHFLTAEILLDSAQDYIDWLEHVRLSKKPLRMVVSTTKISFQATVQSFEYGFKNAYDAEYHYTLALKEFRPYKAKKIETNDPQNSVTPNDAPVRAAPPDKVGMGSKVTVNGQLHRDSQGDGPGQTEQNAPRIISLVAPGALYPYHVTTLDGTSRGWVKESDVSAA
ncbi:hypothetical protein FC83_GL000907 [Agrilactobacillus composti DSM 18527 = JCM 14202]|uniref:Phage protein n=1 Tax=Agrilactobacillus composti DSM 18527 = JCM 14202 TaxID=1423734 RepID=X0QR78_9LACO|nr:hypothetical protein [Agrilactobacillus composti]KRM35604.1 hypothetical protein FC83_GL000907 [Agrilactobacillus composti DSM 18527 = JCM 14202]GAF41120.1 phage-like element PBSX protein XkdP [Agrilactobacillus composti DSM 18527 = JCM 14202]